MRDRKGRGQEIDERRSAAEVRGTLVFSAVIGTDVLELDCMWETEPGQVEVPGRITVALPDCTRATGQVIGLIDRWLEEGKVVAVWIEPDPAGPDVKLKADRTTITLSLAPDAPIR